MDRDSFGWPIVPALAAQALHLSSRAWGNDACPSIGSKIRAVRPLSAQIPEPSSTSAKLYLSVR